MDRLPLNFQLTFFLLFLFCKLKLLFYLLLIRTDFGGGLTNLYTTVHLFDTNKMKKIIKVLILSVIPKFTSCEEDILFKNQLYTCNCF